MSLVAYPRIHDVHFLDKCVTDDNTPVRVKCLGHQFHHTHVVKVIDPTDAYTWTLVGNPTWTNEGEMIATFRIHGPHRRGPGDVNVTVGTAPHAASAPCPVSYTR